MAQTLFKRQAIPGRESEFDLTFEKVGLYHGQCTFCGLAHSAMVFGSALSVRGHHRH
jgi:heme/copper-type cytochrome/quinol oxidase subunit 2